MQFQVITATRGSGCIKISFTNSKIICNFICLLVLMETPSNASTLTPSLNLLTLKLST